MTDHAAHVAHAAELEALEPLLHRLPEDLEPSRVGELVSPAFWEVGASGAVYAREHVLDALAHRGDTPQDAGWTVSDFAARELSPGLWLATYALEQDAGRLSRRSTIWRREGGGWVAEYHQGTLV
ncbi:nuclear transport factor 2 family protein [Homoserinibacter sp. YIM 151385]|uniref:nuclear transport factor 2 family protein n=1 Tax=Homoserinibacter sp. YIM 151385 TaxID=2985506 RepID=UPI0022F0E119|nr:DUF4440 domain-containing protein [Homoserinibacter sp. YIM 151385]WBU38730.1 DUF4440 domain-containing protein [Homoserinibacter sp. YIM 151385]